MYEINVMDFGAKGDGVTDDTAAIQAAINYATERGGGTIFFPYTSGGYIVASPGIEEYEGRQVRAQLIIPPGSANIQLMGEMPCRMLTTYVVFPLDFCEKKGREPLRFGTQQKNNTRIISTWDAPEIHNPEERPWSILSAPIGDEHIGKFSHTQFSMANLEFQVKLDKEKMYPTQTAVNLQNINRINIRDCQFCLDDQIGDTILDKKLMPNPCIAAGLIASADQNDNNVLSNLSVQGFRYGFVLGEHVVADYLYVHNCEEALLFHDVSHISMIYHVVAQHNRVVVATTRGVFSGMAPGPCCLEIGIIDIEPGTGLPPESSILTYGVYDPDHRLHGNMRWFMPHWVREPKFDCICGEDFKVSRF